MSTDLIMSMPYFEVGYKNKKDVQSQSSFKTTDSEPIEETIYVSPYSIVQLEGGVTSRNNTKHLGCYEINHTPLEINCERKKHFLQKGIFAVDERNSWTFDCTVKAGNEEWKKLLPPNDPKCAR